MFTTAIQGETLIQSISYKGIPMELLKVPATMWCGSIAYAANLTDEPDIPALLAKYQANCQYPKLHRANPDWDNAISIDYWQDGKVPRGMMFSQQVTSDEQTPVHDIYRMPESLYIRLACTKETAQAAFERDGCEVFELFGVIKDALDELGYKTGTNGAQEIEMYNHGAGLAYAYVQVEVLDVYTACPTAESSRYRIRPLAMNDCADLLKVYSDPVAVPFFNSDNCHGDDFHYTTAERMRQAIDFWFTEYSRRGFVRWSIVDRHSDEVIGTIELFRREADDFFTDCGLLRLDLRSDYETKTAITELLSLIVPPSFGWFGCSMLATKAIPAAAERRCALAAMGFVPSPEKVIGHDGTEYGDYFVFTK